MVLGKNLSSRRAASGALRRAALPAAALVALVALAACNPIDTWRDLTGASQNDPDPEATPNTANLAAGEASDYPNLATVPPPPTRALTAAERDKLTQSLIADRTNAKYTDDKLRAGFSAISAPVPPPPPPAPPPGEPADKAAKPAPAGAQAPPTQAPPTQAPPAQALPGQTLPAQALPAQAPPTQAQGPRKEGEPPEPGPKESSLAPPQARETPTPEQSRPAPPLPRQVALPAAGGPGAAHLPSPPGPAPMPAAIDTAKYQPPPPPPVLTRPAPSRAAAAAAPEKHPAPAVNTPVGEIKFAGASTSLAESEEPAVDKIVSSYRKEPGKIRVVGYAGVGTNGAGEQLVSYRVALDRARSVAAALAKAGIPSDKILAEVAPADADAGEGRAEVMLEH